MPYSFASRKMRFWVGPTYAPPRSTHFVSLFWNVKKETNNIFDKIKKIPSLITDLTLTDFYKLLFKIFNVK